MKVGDIWTSPVSHFVDAGYKRSNGCRTDSCSSVYEGWVTNRMQLVAHHTTYQTIWGYAVNDVIELTDPYNANSDHFFYARGDQGRFVPVPIISTITPEALRPGWASANKTLHPEGHDRLGFTPTRF